jgi:hypothetical protein
VEAYTVKQFFWQDDLVSVVKFVNACLDKMFLCATGLSNDSQTSDQPDVSGRDIILHQCNMMMMTKPQLYRTTFGPNRIQSVDVIAH